MSSLSGEQPILQILVGSEMSSVEFVRDYIQLRFDGPTLTTFTLPVVTLNATSYDIKTPGYRDALCSLIGREVQNTEILEHVAIRLIFDQNALLEISLREEDYEGPEAAMFDPENGELWVW
ncbi:hypothetical protein [Effusibacillus pohliae]|uniref:hypothetical protein n=1 Tax=Effusibacillus pohliae TaxID=232270 RepID=UPI0003699C27|nr:hypothetical protein [Effusibacillus pohliae]